MFLSYDRPDKFWSTLFLRLGISIAYSRIGSHRYSLLDSLREDACDDRLLSRYTLLALYDRGKYERLVCFLSECCIGSSYFLFPFTEKLIDDHVGV